MTRDLSSNSFNQRVFGGLVSLVFWCVLQLFFTGYWHSGNNYVVLPGSYSLRTIDSTEFSKLSPEQQIGWGQVPDSDNYVLMTVRNSFLFRHVGSQLFLMLVLSILALCTYLWCHGLPSRSLPINLVPETNAGVTI